MLIGCFAISCRKNERRSTKCSNKKQKKDREILNIKNSDGGYYSVGVWIINDIAVTGDRY